MYERFLNNDDYLSIVTEEALSQLIRNREERLAMAEEAAEQSIIEYLTENYEIEKELAIGKHLAEYSRNVTYPAGAHFYCEGKIYEALRTINGCKAPSIMDYWTEYCDFIPNEDEIPAYSQRINYAPGNIVKFANVFYICDYHNGPDFDDIRIPGLTAWELVEYVEWEPNYEYQLWEVVKWEGKYYALISNPDDIDLTINPFDSDNWGLIGDYDPEYNDYELSETEYVVYNNCVVRPIVNPNADILQEGYNIRQHDPRNGNIKKHLLRLAVYELHKLISPNNISSARITDYETSITWLRDASKLKLTPGIPRRLDEKKRPVTDYALATFMREYDPYENPWQI